MNLLMQPQNAFGKKGFCFLESAEGLTALLHYNAIEKSGFKLEDVRATSLLEVEVVEGRGGFYVATVKTIDGKDNRPPVKIDQFSHLFEEGKNVDTGERVWEVSTPRGGFVQYIVSNPDGLVLRQLGKVSREEARANIGLVKPKPMKVRKRSRQQLVREFAEAMHP